MNQGPSRRVFLQTVFGAVTVIIPRGRLITTIPVLDVLRLQNVEHEVRYFRRYGTYFVKEIVIGGQVYGNIVYEVVHARSGRHLLREDDPRSVTEFVLEPSVQRVIWWSLDETLTTKVRVPL